LETCLCFLRAVARFEENFPSSKEEVGKDSFRGCEAQEEVPSGAEGGLDVEGPCGYQEAGEEIEADFPDDLTGVGRDRSPLFFPASVVDEDQDEGRGHEANGEVPSGAEGGIDVVGSQAHQDGG